MKTVKKSAKMQAGGVASKKIKAPMVDPKGAWTKVQERTLGSMKKGGSIKKAQSGEKVKGTVIGPAARVREYSIDTTGYAAGKKKFPASVKTTIGTKNKKETQGESDVSRGEIKSFLKGKTIYSGRDAIDTRQKNGGKLSKKK